MPLLMTEATDGESAPEATVDIDGGRGATVVATRPVALDQGTGTGGAGCRTLCVHSARRHRVSFRPPLRVFGGTFSLRMGTRLVTNRRRPVLVVGRDSVRQHDLLLPATEECRGEVIAAVAHIGYEPPKIPDPVNLFASVSLTEDGRLHGPVSGPSGSGHTSPCSSVRGCGGRLPSRDCHTVGTTGAPDPRTPRKPRRGSAWGSAAARRGWTRLRTRRVASGHRRAGT